MRVLLENMAVRLYAHRGRVARVCDWLILLSVCCMICYGAVAQVLNGQEQQALINGRDLHDTVISDNLRLQDHKDRIERLEAQQILQNNSLSSHDQSIALIHEKLLTLEDSQSTITKLLWALLVVFVTKIAIDMFRPKPQTTGNYEANGGAKYNRRHDDPVEEYNQAEVRR